MSRIQPRKRFDLWLAMKKMALSGFVIFTFLAYVIDQHLTANKQTANTQPVDPGLSATTPPQSQTFSQPQNQTFTQPQTSFSQAQQAQPPAPTQAPPAAQQPAAPQQGQYKDGTYNGNVADAYYGMLQVQAVIQNGKLSQVQILQYPHDRRTSQYINSQALPWLQQEAVQAQSANVDFISGATLSSNAFQQSLQSALQSAHG